VDKATVLVVDDTPENIQLVAATLSDLYRVRVANSGVKALALIERGPPPDLILLDVMMPEMDGHEVCRRLQADPATRGIPILFLTAMTQVEDETLGFELGAVDYIHKPISPPVLLARTRTQLGLLEARRQLAREKALVDHLLDSLLPAAAVAELKARGTVEPRQFDDVAVLFCDLAGFTRYCSDHTPQTVVETLEKLFRLFEECARQHGLEKIKTIGDAFLATANLLEPRSDPAGDAVRCGLAILEGASALGWAMRSGVHVGPVMAGVVGQERYQFDIWGDTVNVAARLAAAGSEGRVTLTEDTARRLSIPASTRGQVELKGKGLTALAEVGA